MRIAYYKDGDIYVFGSQEGTTRVTDDGANGQPQWTSDGKTLFFVERRQGQPDETWQWHAGEQPQQVHAGLWSPDGQRVAYPQSPAGSVPASTAVSVDDEGKQQQVTPNESGVRWSPLAWSPDSHRLALSRYSATGTMTQAGMQFGSATLWVTGQTLGERTQLPMPKSSTPSMGTWADLAQWSPDGNFLLVGAGPAQPCNSCRADGVPMYADPLGGGAPISLEHALPRGAMSWSSAGDWLIISSGPLGRATYSQMRLTRFNLDKQTHADLTSDPAWSDVEPAVAPDGSEIAFVRGHSQRQGETTVSAIASRRLWVMTADGSQAHQVVPSSSWTEEAPSWSSDGKWIVFIRLPANPDAAGIPSLWAVHPDGSGLQQLVSAFDTTVQPSGRFGYYGEFAWLQLYAVAPH